MRYDFTVILTVTFFICLFRGIFHCMCIASLIFNLNAVAAISKTLKQDSSQTSLQA